MHTINQSMKSDFYSANIPREAMLNGGTAKSGSNDNPDINGPSSMLVFIEESSNQRGVFSDVF